MHYKNTLLLDFDGVVFKNHKLHNLVSHRCEMFVSKYNIPKVINKQLYQSTGHTIIGLKRLGVKPVPTIEEFNEYIYKDIDYKSIINSIDDKQKKTLKKITRITTPYIFSNAPDVWCDTISEILFNKQFPTTSKFTGSLVKPDPRAYMKIEKHLKSDHYIFVDDKIENLPYISPKWTRIWMNDTYSMKVQDDLYFITDLDHLIL